jgi:steroid 5-alpha reductase family enzyme
VIKNLIKIAFACVIIILGFASLFIHYSTNKLSNVQRLASAYPGHAELASLVLGGVNMNWFAVLVLVLSILYGVSLLVFSADRLSCTMSTSAACDGMTKLNQTEKAALKI